MPLPYEIKRDAARRLARLAGMKRVVRRAVLPAAPVTHSFRAEGEDAALTGMTRSLQRRLIGLNLPTVVKPASLRPA